MVTKKDPKKKITKKTVKAKTTKKEAVKPVLKKETAKPAVDPNKYLEAIGKRKSAVARVRIFTQGKKIIEVNQKTYEEYFPTVDLQKIVFSALDKMKCADRFRIIVRVKGGGFHAQAEAVRHGISRGLVDFNQNFKKRLRKAGFLTRDPRTRERKKFGLKRARRAPQWKKR